MFTLTPAAAAQIRKAALDAGFEGLPLRVAARREPDGSVTYGMGFDEPHDDEPPSLQAEGISVLIAARSRPLLDGIVLDFVELNPGEFNFIFVPDAAAPRSPGGCGSCSGGSCGPRGAC